MLQFSSISLRRPANWFAAFADYLVWFPEHETDPVSESGNAKRARPSIPVNRRQGSSPGRADDPRQECRAPHESHFASGSDGSQPHGDPVSWSDHRLPENTALPRAANAADVNSLTERGEQLTKPRDQEEQLEALRAGMRAIPLFNQMLSFYNNNKLPETEFLRNALGRDPFKVEREWAEEAATVFTGNGRDVGFVRTINNSPYVLLESGPPIEPEAAESRTDELTPPSEAAGVAGAGTQRAGIAPNNGSSAAQPVSVQAAEVTPAVPHEPTRPENRQFFIAHGWDKEAVAQAQVMLNRLRIPFVVAQDEVMFGWDFSADEEFKDKDGNSLWRPRENVIYELGAASLEYGQRIVIFTEKGVYLPTDFRDMGYIEHEKGSLDAKAMGLTDGTDCIRCGEDHRSRLIRQ